MKILFSPSEAKSEDGSGPKINDKSFIFEEHYDKRLVVLRKYSDFIDSADTKALSKLFGVKEKEAIARYRQNIFEQKTEKAVRRYTGTAYDYLGYDSLDIHRQEYIDKNSIIFSNIFGPIRAGDLVPDYKFKQGSRLPDFNIEQFYKESFSKSLDEYLGDHILDLRAGFYEKFYSIKVPYISFKFIKNGKVVSHWAKAYRGIMLKELSYYKPQDYKELKSINFQNISLVEIQKKSLNETWVMQVE